MADGIIGSVGVGVVPDATDFWRRFVAATQAGAEDAGRKLGRGVRRGIDEELARPVDIRVNADTARARAQIASLSNSSNSDFKKAAGGAHLLRDAIIALGPATIPVAGVLSGAFIGLVPTLGAVALGIKGVSDEFKAGQLDGTVYGADIKALQQEFSTLKTIASGGILVGLNNAMAGSGPLLRAVNADTAQLSAQFGQIAGDAAPALLSLLTQLNPLFNVFGQVLVEGADHLKAWAASGKGVSGFVSYVQGELPTVIKAVQSLAVTAAHLVESLAPLGHASLVGISALSNVINAIPVDVLTKLETVAVGVYAAFRTYGAITAIVNAVSGAVAASAARQEAAALQVTAASLALQATAAQEAAVVAETRYAEARASTAAALQIATALEGTGSALEAEALAAVEAAGVFAGAMRAEAAAAAATAESVAASSAEASAAARAGAVGATTGFAGALGPIGALVAGLAVVGFAFANTGDDAQAAADAQNAYAASVKNSTDAMSRANLESTRKALSDKGALVGLQALHDANLATGVSFNDLSRAVNGSQKDFDSVQAAILSAAGPGSINAVNKLLGTLKLLRGGLGDQIKVQLALEAAERQATQAREGGSQAALANARAFGVTKDAYLAAATAAHKNAEDTRAQTLQMQLANDAAGLLKQAFDRLSGKKISYAQADNAFQQSLVSLQKNFRDGSKAINGLTEGAINNRGSLIGLVTQAQQAAEAYGTLNHSTEAGRQKFAELRQSIIDNAVAQGANRAEVTAFVDSLAKIPRSVPPTKAQIDKDKAEGDIAKLRADINAIRQDRVPQLHANTLEAREQVQELLDKIARLQNKDITVTTHLVQAGGLPTGQKHPVTAVATGGIIRGPGSGTSDTAGIFALSNGEAVIPAKAVSANRDLINSLIVQGRGMAAGGVVILDPTKGSGGGSSRSSSGSSSRSSSGSARTVKIDYQVDGKHYASLHAAENAALSIYNANVKLSATIEGKGFASWRKALAGSVADAKAAFATIRDGAKKLGVSDAFVRSLTRIQTKTEGFIRDRTRVQAALGDPPNNATTAYDRLAAATQKFKDERSAVADAITGSFNIAQAGANPVTGAITGAGELAQSNQNRALVRKFVADANKLKGKINDTYWAQLVSAGPSSLPQIDALLSLSKAGRAQIDANQRAVAGAAASLGQVAAQRLYGGQVRSAQIDVKNLQNRLHTDNTHIANEVKAMRRELSTKIDHYADRPVLVLADGRVIARVVNEANNKSKARQ